MEFIQFMEYTCLVVTLILFSTGIAPCLDMYKTGDTRNVPFLIFLLSAVGCIGTTHYGYILGLETIFVLNVIGGILNVIYCLIYLTLVKDKGKPVFYSSVSCAYFACLYGYAFTVLEDDMSRANVIGACSSLVITIIMILPAFELIDNIRNHNADGMPLIMLCSGIFSALCWLIYGLLLEDANIYAPNIPGILINLAKLYVIYLYGSQDVKKKKSE